MGLVRYLVRHLAGRQPRVVRRVAVRCPRAIAAADLVVVDLLMGGEGKPSAVLRCSCRPEVPPTCDQCCRLRPEAVLNRAQIVLVAPGDGPPAEID